MPKRDTCRLTPERPGVSLKDIVRDITSYILYIIGMVIIEVYLKPMFGDEGIPFVSNFILIIGELCILAKLAWKLFKVIDAFAKDFLDSSICKIISNNKNRKNQ